MCVRLYCFESTPGCSVLRLPSIRPDRWKRFACQWTMALVLGPLKGSQRYCTMLVREGLLRVPVESSKILHVRLLWCQFLDEEYWNITHVRYSLLREMSCCRGLQQRWCPKIESVYDVLRPWLQQKGGSICYSYGCSCRWCDSVTVQSNTVSWRMGFWGGSAIAIRTCLHEQNKLGRAPPPHLAQGFLVEFSSCVEELPSWRAYD